jgi:biopolymer transport protein ExbB
MLLGFVREVVLNMMLQASANRRIHIAWLAAGLLVLILAAMPAKAASAADSPPDTSATTKTDSPAADKSAAGQSGEGPESLLAWLNRSLGPRFTLIFFALTLVLVALMVVNVLAVRRDGIAPLSLIQGLELRLGEDRFQDSCDLVRADRSFLARVIAAGLPHLTAIESKTANKAVYASATSAMEEFGSLESIKLHARLGYVWLVAQLAPLFGLLGTIDGLIAAFDVIVHKGATPRPIDLAGGIGTALVSTAVGLWIAIVAVAFHQLVLARLNRLLAEAGILAERFAERFAAARKA